MTHPTDGIHVNHAGLDLGAQDLAATVTAIDQRLQQLAGELAPLHSDWQGSAQTAYAAAKLTWDRAMEEMRALLELTVRQVHQANADYRAADLRGARAFELG